MKEYHSGKLYSSSGVTESIEVKGVEGVQVEEWLLWWNKEERIIVPTI